MDDGTWMASTINESGKSQTPSPAQEGICYSARFQAIPIMSFTASIVILAVAALLLFLIIQQWRRSRPSKAAEPDCTLEEAWDHYLAHRQEWSERDRLAIESLSATELLDPLRSRLQEVIDTALAASNPLVSLRRAIMDAADRFVMIETLGGTTPASEERLSAAESVLEKGALRCFSKLRFADFSDDDWYTHYLRLAEMNANNVAAMVQATVKGQPTSIETSLHEPLTQAMARARQVLLLHPKQEAVDRTTRLDEASGIRPPSPSQAQIDEISELMKRHFQDLFTARIYGIGDRNPASPAAAVHVDAVLLYSMLALEFTQPHRAWRQIMEHALGGDAEALHGEEELLRCASHAQQVWLDHQDNEPFDAALRVACDDAVASTNPEHADALAENMKEEALELARGIRDILRQPEAPGHDA